MGDLVFDKSIPFDLSGLEIRHRHGYDEAVCPGCGAWVRLSELYNANRTVIKAIPHIPRCSHYENLFRSL